MVSTAMVLLMSPALGFFYGGLVRSKNVLNTMMMSVISIGVVGICWAVLGYSLAFGQGSGWAGGLEHALLRGVDLEPGRWGAFPHLLFFAYQGSFAIIATALVSGHWSSGSGSGRTWRSSRSGACSFTPRWRTGSGVAAGWRSSARSTSRVVPWCTLPRAWRRWSRRW
jgi:hypothetical protein